MVFLSDGAGNGAEVDVFADLPNRVNPFEVRTVLFQKVCVITFQHGLHDPCDSRFAAAARSRQKKEVGNLSAVNQTLE